MSNKQNDIWLQDRYEDFSELLADGQFENARKIIQELRDNGFDKEANNMQIEAYEEEMHQFINNKMSAI